MPSQRKRIGYLPSKEVHEIIDKLCRANDFSQSKVTGLLVEEALKSRGVLRGSFSSNLDEKDSFINDFFEKDTHSNKNRCLSNSDVYAINKNEFPDNVKMMHEFIEYKYFKNVMRQNKHIFES